MKGLFEKVQAVNAEEALVEKKKEKRADAAVDFRDMLRGKVICGDCKSKIQKIIGGGKSRYDLLPAMPQAKQQADNHPNARTSPLVGCRKRNIHS